MGFWDFFGDITEGISDAASSVGNFISDAVSSGVDKAGNVGNRLLNTVDNAVNATGNLLGKGVDAIPGITDSIGGLIPFSGSSGTLLLLGAGFLAYKLLTNEEFGNNVGRAASAARLAAI